MSDTLQTFALAGSLGAALLLQGCGTPPEASTTPDYYVHNATTLGPYTTTTTTELATNIWQWRRDMLMHQQISWDVSDKPMSYSYEPCWAKGGHTVAGGEEMLWTPLDEQMFVDGQHYGSYDGETGVTLSNKQANPNEMGCLMRKSRYPIDFSEIGRIEFDVSSSGDNTTAGAPWSAIWFAPMTYYRGGWPDWGDLSLAAEIDVIENFATDGPWMGSSISTQFSSCTDPAHCQTFHWDGVDIRKLDHHITMKMTTEDDGTTRVVRIVRCPQPAKTCADFDAAQEFAQLRSSPNFPVWDKANAGELYGKYWMVSDIWYTSGAEFTLSVGNISFFWNNETEWHMPLGGKPFLPEGTPLVTTTMSPPDEVTTTSQDVLV